MASDSPTNQTVNHLITWCAWPPLRPTTAACATGGFVQAVGDVCASCTVAGCLCRQCHGLTYATAQSGGDLMTTIDNRLYFIRGKVGGTWHFLHGPGAKPRGMHWRTYGCLVTEYRNLLRLRDIAWMAGAVNLLGGLNDTSKRAEELRAAVKDEWREHKADPYKWTPQARALVEDDDDPQDESNRLTLGDLAQRARRAPLPRKRKPRGLSTPTRGAPHAKSNIGPG